MGTLYNNASIGVEVNNHGLTSLTKLRNRNYTRIFYSQNLQARGKKMERIGFATTTHTKPLIIDGIAAYFDVGKGNPDPFIPDAELISEAQTYGIFEDGRTGAQESCNDDRIMAFGIALHVSKFAGISRFFPSAGG